MENISSGCLDSASLPESPSKLKASATAFAVSKQYHLLSRISGDILETGMTFPSHIPIMKSHSLAN